MKKDFTFQVNLLPIRRIIVLPGTTVSFNLLDEKYIKMMRDTVSRDEYVVVSMTDEVEDEAGESVPQSIKPRKVAILAKPSMVEIEPNGLYHGGIILEGICRVKINKILSTQPYIVIESTILDTDLSSYDGDVRIVNLIERLTKLNVKDLEGCSTEHVVGSGVLVLVADREHQQFLLEIDSVKDQLEHLWFILQFQDMGIHIPLKALGNFASSKIQDDEKIH